MYASMTYNDKKESKVLGDLLLITLNFWTVCKSMGSYLVVKTYAVNSKYIYWSGLFFCDIPFYKHILMLYITKMWCHHIYCWPHKSWPLSSFPLIPQISDEKRKVLKDQMLYIKGAIFFSSEIWGHSAFQKKVLLFYFLVSLWYFGLTYAILVMEVSIDGERTLFQFFFYIRN